MDGIELVTLHTHTDARGSLTELFREDWVDDRPVQWNLVRSRPNTLRGVHVHVRHADYVVPIAGTLVVGLCDLREESASFKTSRIVELSSERPALLKIPPGIAHGFCFLDEMTFSYGVTSYWDPVEDELGCRWDDPGLDLQWPVTSPLLSARDAAAQPLAVLLEELRARRIRC
ncbi:MAG: dTDP-4-dehydrorhamnose 3,5-epimerase [Candidatus Eremiobacteraeota bacterium]|nr:dTDP-4-dehydrorhamnose 3,5-epimerase [Candidatus Eremiobacteraeota bacterium]